MLQLFMNLIIVVSILFAISLVWALFSLKKELKRPKELDHVEKELKKEKILFQR